MSPAVPNETVEQPVKLERVEISPGNFIKMSPADKEAFEKRTADDAATAAAYQRTLAGETDEPAAADTDVVPLTILTKAELVELAEKRGLATSGSKDKIASRFAEPDEDEEADAEDDEDEGGA